MKQINSLHQSELSIRGGESAEDGETARERERDRAGVEDR